MDSKILRRAITLHQSIYVGGRCYPMGGVPECTVLRGPPLGFPPLRDSGSGVGPGPALERSLPIILDKGCAAQVGKQIRER